MKWITRERAKVDRIACPWLISRFLDPSPEFLYVPADRVLVEAARQGAVPYDVAGVELGHQGAFCSFDALLRKYGLEGNDPALDRLALIVRGADTAAKDLTEIFVVLYVTNVLGLSATTFGALVALRMATSILVYLPVATLADRQGRTPFVVARKLYRCAVGVLAELACSEQLRVLRPLPAPPRYGSRDRGTGGGIRVRGTAGNWRTGAQGDDRGPGRGRPARADGGGILLHARPRGDAGQPDRRTPLAAGAPDPLLRRGWDLLPGGDPDGEGERAGMTALA